MLAGSTILPFNRAIRFARVAGFIFHSFLTDSIRSEGCSTAYGLYAVISDPPESRLNSVESVAALPAPAQIATARVRPCPPAGCGELRGQQCADRAGASRRGGAPAPGTQPRWPRHKSSVR